jgi:hypothetical protein
MKQIIYNEWFLNVSPFTRGGVYPFRHPNNLEIINV